MEKRSQDQDYIKDRSYVVSKEKKKDRSYEHIFYILSLSPSPLLSITMLLIILHLFTLGAATLLDPVPRLTIQVKITNIAPHSFFVQHIYCTSLLYIFITYKEN